MNLRTLLKPWVSLPLINCRVMGLHNDSRQIQQGFLFFAYLGAISDGRYYIQQAFAAGACAVIYDPIKWPSDCLLPPDSLTIALSNLTHHMAAIAARFYHQPSRKMTLTAVTGTNGKTTIAFQLAQAHQQLRQPSAYIGTLGHGLVTSLTPSSNTTPDALHLQHLCYTYHTMGIKHVCLEVSSHALDQWRVEALSFEQAIFTNLTLDHLDYHHTMQNYAKAKAKLFAYPSLKWAIINNDDAYSLQMKTAVNVSCKLLTFGIHNPSDVQALRYQLTLEGTVIDVQSPHGIHQLTIKALGLFNIYNTLAIFSSLIASGYEIHQIITVISQLIPAPGRMEIVAVKPYVIIDYAHTPDALENVLQTLNAVKKARLIVVFGCGGDRDKSKRAIMGHIASKLADIIIVTSDNPRYENPEHIIDSIMAGITLNSSHCYRFVERTQAIRHALSLATAMDILLIAGKGHETYQQIGDRREFFSDKEVVEQLQ
jgi:UDP-N-acetylmuramoyl-L-alanyl-D-glutamate--2,6-diaminopimelate ligase